MIHNRVSTSGLSEADAKFINDLTDKLNAELHGFRVSMNPKNEAYFSGICLHHDSTTFHHFFPADYRDMTGILLMAQGYAKGLRDGSDKGQSELRREWRNLLGIQVNHDGTLYVD